MSSESSTGMADSLRLLFTQQIQALEPVRKRIRFYNIAIFFMAGVFLLIESYLQIALDPKMHWQRPASEIGAFEYGVMAAVLILLMLVWSTNAPQKRYEAKLKSDIFYPAFKKICADLGATGIDALTLPPDQLIAPLSEMYQAQRTFNVEASFRFNSKIMPADVILVSVDSDGGQTLAVWRFPIRVEWGKGFIFKWQGPQPNYKQVGAVIVAIGLIVLGLTAVYAPPDLKVMLSEIIVGGLAAGFILMSLLVSILPFLRDQFLTRSFREAHSEDFERIQTASRALAKVKMSLASLYQDDHSLYVLVSGLRIPMPIFRSLNSERVFAQWEQAAGHIIHIHNQLTRQLTSP